MSKNILIFSDGTGQAGGLRPDQRLSNVYKLYKATRIDTENNIDPEKQIAYYDAGLGSDEISVGFDSIKKYVQKFLDAVTGRGITKNITDCYEAIINYYEPGDRIFLFGFSRGAYTVRSVASVLNLCGVPKTTKNNEPLPRFKPETRRIAFEAVSKVYEHGAGFKRSNFAGERNEKARRFREKYNSDNNGRSNVSPHFIGVFDTVAALGAKGLLRLFMLLVIAVCSFGLIAAVSWILTETLNKTGYVQNLQISFAVVVFYLLVKSFKSSFKFIGDYPTKGKFTFHFAKWRMRNYDLGLDIRVPFARHALAIDETRRDFPQVKWHSVHDEFLAECGDIEPLVQLWFPGNHSDIGGSYPENESRLSDNALEWMVGELKSIPNPILINEELLNIYPSVSAMQHSEVESFRDRFPRWWPKRFRFSWPEKPRVEASEANHHESVKQRFELPYVIDSGRKKPYRPEALKNDSRYQQYYSDSE